MNDEQTSIRESFFAEVLMSLIVSLCLQSCLMIIRGFNEFLTIRMFTQLIPLILSVIHTVIRRKWPKLLPCFILHIASSVLFFLLATLIPGSKFGYNLSNKVYLAVTVFVFTVSSFTYRLNPRIQPSDTQIAAIPACIFPIFGLFYVMMGRADLIEDLISNTILTAVIYLVMRQVAVFDARYYHSIRSSSKPPAHLRKQNYKTAAALVGIFALSLGVLRLIPVAALAHIVLLGIQAILRAVIPVIIAIIDFFNMIFQDVSEAYDPMEELRGLDDPVTDERWLKVVAAILAVLILIGFVLLIINTIRLLIINAPRFGREKESTGDGTVIDEIEIIRPDRKPFFRKRPDFGKGYERKIRKQFYNKTANAMRKGLPVSGASTPRQIESVLLANGDKEIQALRNEYEKVRYGN